MATQISLMLAVRRGAAAIEFYKQAFRAVELRRVDAGGLVGAGLSIAGVEFFLADESPAHGQRAPDLAGHTTVRIELFVDDPSAVHSRAVAAGARETSPPQEHRNPTVGPRPIRRILQSAVVDPFGHVWLIGRVLEYGSGADR